MSALTDDQIYGPADQQAGAQPQPVQAKDGTWWASTQGPNGIQVQQVAAPTAQPAAPSAPGPQNDDQLFGPQGGPSAPLPPPAEPKSDQGLGFQVGLTRPIDNMSYWLEQGVRHLPGGAAFDDALESGWHNLTGLPTDQQTNAQNQQYVAAQAAKGHKPGFAGEMAGNLLTTLPLTLAGGGPIVGGALTGAVSTEHPDSLTGTASDAALGGLFGKAGDAVTGAVSHVLSPKLSPAVQALVNEGVKLTPGQTLGGWAQNAEGVMDHLPILGQLIKSARADSVKSFNTAALNRALAPIGATLPPGAQYGHAAVEAADDALSNRYRSILPGLQMQADPGFQQSIGDAMRQAPISQRDQLADIIQQYVLPKFGPTGQLGGNAMQDIDAQLGSMSRGYSRSQDYDQNQLADALRTMQGGLRDMVSRQNPQQAPLLDAAREGWANLVRVERAAGSTGAKEGVFTPGMLQNAVKASDGSVRKNAVGQGTALMQDLSRAGQSVLPSTVPDSGTAGRGLMDAALLGMAGGGAEHMGAHVLNPVTLGVGAMLGAPYTKPGLAATRYLLSGSRPQAARSLAAIIDAYGRPAITAAAGAGAPAAQQYLTGPGQ